MATVETAIRWLALALDPIGSLADDDEHLLFLGQLGWALPSVPDAWHTVADATDDLLASLAALSDQRMRIEAGQATSATNEELALATDLTAMVASVAALGDGFRVQLPAAFIATTHIDEQIVERLYEALVERFLHENFGLARAVLIALGVIETSEQPEDPATYQTAYTAVALHWERLATALTDPGQLLHDVYGWGTDAIDSARLFDALIRLSFYFGAPAEAHLPLPATVTALDPAHGTFTDDQLAWALWIPLYYQSADGVFAVLTPLPTTAGIPQRLAATLALRGTVADSVPLRPSVTLALEGAVEMGSNAAVVFGPGEDPRIVIGSAPDVGEGRISATVQFAVSPGPARLLALSETSALDVEQIALSLAATRTSGAPPDLTIELAMTKLHLRVAPGDSGGDGFLGAVLPSGGIDATVDGTLTWSTTNGVHISGGAGLTLSLPMSKSFGPLRLTSIGLGITAASSGIALASTVSGTVTLGPVTLGLDSIGLTSTLAFTAGNLGPLDLDVGFQPPKTLALGIAAPSVSGGGALSVDPAHGRYAGQLVLDIFGVKVSAYGLVETKPPGGGYSLAAVISAQFRPIQLGLGLTLNGVGGLVAINRRVDGDALRTALRGAGVGDIFFASDPIAQAGRLLGDLGTYFPAANGRYAFGPAFKIGWGTPTIVEAELAVLLEMPAPVRLFLLGSAYTTLPTKDHPLIRLQVDVVGEYDVTEKRLAIDATLRDSRVLAFPITGDFALRASWGSQKTFVLSVGGFHSQFRPPPDFPTLRRVRIPIGADDDPRLDITGFLAVTSNTAQIGASIDLYASAGPLNIHGNVGFEALFQFSPFAFEAELSAGVELRRGTTTLASIHLDGTLTGTTPWHVAGEACLSCWLFDLCVPFSAPFGSDAPVELPPTAIWPVVQPVLEDPASWAAELPANAARAVTTAPAVDATADEASAAHIDPVAALTVRQKIVPLDRTVTRFAQGAPTDITQLTVTGATIGTGAAAYTPVTDWFAPAQFEDLSDADRLSRDGFELMDAGVSLGSDATLAGSELVVPLEYETVTIPSPPAPPERYRPTLSAQLLSGQLGTVERGPQLVALGGLPEEAFAIASAEDLTIRGDLVAPGPRGVAELALLAHLAAHPEEAGHVIVVPTHELVA